MIKKRLTIEPAAERFETLLRQDRANGTSSSGFLRRMIDEFRLRPPTEDRKKYQTDPLYNRRGSFDGPADLSENHDHYLY